MTKYIILIDQAPLIQQAIDELESWHDKIETLEIQIQRFQDTDLKLYNEWFQLTSQNYQRDIDIVFTAYQKIAEFHNWVVYTAEDKNVSLPEAYYLMVQEEEQFLNGTADERARILKLREQRQKAINGEMDDESNDDGDYSDDAIFDDISEEDQQKQAQEQLKHARAYHERELHYYDMLSEKQIRKIMKDDSDGLMLLVQCVTIALETYRYDLILKIWNCTPPKIKKTFNKGFQKEFGMSLDDLLERVTEKAREDAGVDEEDEFNFARHFESPFEKSSAKKTQWETRAPEDSELAKIYYRRLMQKVHPDKLKKEFVSTRKNWLERLWKKIQTAYSDQNVRSLKNLYLQVLISLKHYDEVTYSELKQGAELLKKEYTRIRESQAQTLSHPAWGFSHQKSYKKLEKEIAEPYKENKKRLTRDKTRLEELHASLKQSAEAAMRTGGFPPPFRKRKRRARRRR